jgi:hypothetical protein
VDLGLGLVPPDDADLDHPQAGAPGQMEELDVPGEAADRQALEETSRRLAAHELEAALRVGEVGEPEQPEPAVVGLAHGLAVEGLPAYDAGLGRGAAAGHQVRLRGPRAQRLDLLDGSGEIGVAQQHPLTA